ncbi:DEHA2A03168p [Debaryomyces hansenii CBS767]|uniref:DEHA2A03168p n=1 Tax=Debaryomyces hansenii (strain ATCC 36239 / CBS 767 / BCRC 21394 / JCM 1990 / NBRC 0083 / IGC 2968) TaxID=284592 RepID=Q6BZ88_DEBHA|nr:DEHA2A03168p [Debaryomyces hansenii CBS767]CAG84433.2 DEHA2A03168p [Debaryomyces hansenii CBS767]|eukprot:XP_456481.2 DEHA2A03168p [Debaryomyces hansenii CBS767]
MPQTHSTAINSYNSNHSSYDQLRPSFSPKIVDQFLVDLGLGSIKDNKIVYDNKKKILELAAGTGKFTRNLVDHGWSDQLIVVEPSEGMLKTFDKKFPEIRKFQGSSYDIPLPDSSVDSVIIAQGFHWFSDESSLIEINRVLKSTGTLGCIWNFDAPSISQNLHHPLPETKILYDNIAPEVESKLSVSNSNNVSLKIKEFFALHPWCVEVSEYIYSFDIKVPQYRHGKWKELLCKENKYFSPISKEIFLLYISRVKPEDVYKYWETRSFITDLNADERLEIQKKVESLVRNVVTENDKTKLNGDNYLEKSMGTHSIVTKVIK